jgi:transmembrane sensor
MAHEPDPTLSISEQAAHWWTVLHEDDASAADRREFGEWVAKSPERVEAYLRTARLMRALKSPVIRWPDAPVNELIRAARVSPADAVPLSGSRARASADLEAQPRSALLRVRARAMWLPLRRPLWVAGLALLIVIGSTAAYLLSPQQYRTRFGEQRLVLLDDGSRVTLNTASRIEVRFTKDRRRVRLLEGEALFEVAHDALRPFIVESAAARVRAVGTQFDVYRQSLATMVTVIEGRVAVVRDVAEPAAFTRAPPGIPGSVAVLPVILVSAGEQVAVTARAITPLAHANVAAATSWTQRRLVFDHTPLNDVAHEFARYSRMRIRIEGDALKAQQVTGVFRSDDPASFLAFLANTPGIEIRDGEGDTRIVMASSH